MALDVSDAGQFLDVGMDVSDADSFLSGKVRGRTWGEAATDTGKQLAKGVNTTLGAIPNLISPDSGLAKFFNDNAQYWENDQSQVVKMKAAAADAEINRIYAEEGALEATKAAIAKYGTDPTLASKFFFENVASMIPGVGAAKGAQAASMAKALSVGPLSQAGMQAAGQAASKAGLLAAGGTNAVMNAGGARQDAYEDIKRTLMANGMPEAQANEEALNQSWLAAGVGGVAGAVSGATGLESGLMKVAGKGGIRKFATGMGAELLGEQVEEVSPQVATNLQLQGVDGRKWTHQLPQTIAQTLVASGPGGVMAGVTQATAKPEDVLKAPDVDTAIQAASAVISGNDIREIDTLTSQYQEAYKTSVLEPEQAIAEQDAAQTELGAIEQRIGDNAVQPSGPMLTDAAMSQAVTSADEQVGSWRNDYAGTVPSTEQAIGALKTDRPLSLPSPNTQSATGALIANESGVVGQQTHEQQAQSDQFVAGQNERRIDTLPDRRNLKLEQNDSGTFVLNGNQTIQQNLPEVKAIFAQYGLTPRTYKNTESGTVLLLGKKSEQAAVVKAVEAVNTRFTPSRDQEILMAENPEFKDIDETQAQVPSVGMDNEGQNQQAGAVPESVPNDLPQAPQPTADQTEELGEVFTDGKVLTENELPANDNTDKTFNKIVEKDGKKYIVQTTKKRMSRYRAAFIRRLVKMFGGEAVFFEGGSADGFNRRGNRVYINVDSGIDGLAVAGHELRHALKAKLGDRHAGLIAATRKLLTDERMKAHAEKYLENIPEGATHLKEMKARLAEGKLTESDKNLLAEEYSADIMGNMWRDPAQLKLVFDAIVEAHPPSVARDIIKTLGDAIITFIEKLKVAAKKGFDTGSDLSVEELNSLQTEIRALMKDAFMDTARSRNVNSSQNVSDRSGNENTLFSLRSNDFNDPEDRLEVSTTVPTPSDRDKRTSNPITEKWVIDTEDMRAGTKHIQAAVDAVAQYNTVIADPTQGEGVLDELRKVVVDNLLKLHDMMPEKIRARAKLWYDGANKIANDWTKMYGISLRQASGVLAVFSPQMDWFKNVSLAERAILIAKKKRNAVWNSDMTAWVRSYVDAAATFKDREDRLELFKFAQKLEGKMFKYMSLEEKARFVRVYDETYHERSYRIITPEGGFGEYVTKGEEDENGDLEEASVTWGSYATIEKALSILDDGSFKNVSDKLGNEHKVRNFYNNIASPNSADGHVTIDTHAIAAAMFKALSGKAIEVSHNFGTTPKGKAGAGQTKATGASGTYGLFADAYREAAAQRGLLAREMQSITWEAVRSLFPAGQKKQMQPKVEAVWDKFKKGEIDRAEAERQVLAISGGLRPMQWEGHDAGTTAAEGGLSFEHVKQKPRKLAPANTKEKVQVSLSAYTQSIPALRQLRNMADKGNKQAGRVLQEIALTGMNDLLKGTSAKVSVEYVTGLYGGATEPSLSASVTFSHAERKEVLARLKQYAEAFDQEQVHVLRHTKEDAGHIFADGSYATPMYVFDLRQQLSRKDVQKVIDSTNLYGLTFGDNFISAYFVKSIGKDAKPIEDQINDFHAGIKQAQATLGNRAEKAKQRVARIWAYGDRGDGAIGWPGISGDVPAESRIRKSAIDTAKSYVKHSKEFVGPTNFSPSRSYAASHRFDRGDAEAGLRGSVQPEGVNAVGIHFSKQERASLSSAAFGQGMRGAEWDRLSTAEDDRIKQRIYFYVNSGKGITPESDVGNHAHVLNLKNLYDYDNDPRDLRLRRTANEFESAVLDNEFDGYISNSRGVAILLGQRTETPTYIGLGSPQNVPLAGKAEKSAYGKAHEAVAANKSLPMGQMQGKDWKRLMAALMPEIDVSQLDDEAHYYKDQIVRKPKVGADKTAFSTFRAVDTESPEFLEWFGDSKVVDADGKPLRVYHGTASDFTEFDPAKTKVVEGVFLTPSKSAGSMYSDKYGQQSDGANVMPLYVSMKNPRIIDASKGDYYNTTNLEAALSDGKHDGVMVYDHNGDLHVLIVKNPTQIKSAISNTGEFSDTNPDIRFSTSRLSDDLEAQQVFLTDKAQQAGYKTIDEFASNDIGGFVKAAEEWRKEHEVEALFTTRRDWYYSQLESSIDQIPKKVTTGSEIAVWLKANAGNLKVKKEELEWSGVLDYLAMRGKEKVSSADVKEFLQKNGVKVDEVMLGESGPDLLAERKEIYDKLESGEITREEWAAEIAKISDISGRPTKHASGNLVLPGGTDHREIVLTVPTIEPYNESDSTHYGDVGKGKQIAWARVNTRTDADGNKVLFVEEVQSQRNAHGRKQGFGNAPDNNRPITEADRLAAKDYFEVNQKYWDNADEEERNYFVLDMREREAKRNPSKLVPTAPFVSTIQHAEVKQVDSKYVVYYGSEKVEIDGKEKTVPKKVAEYDNKSDATKEAERLDAQKLHVGTDAYISLVLKRLIAYAVDNGFDAISWTTGEQQADRYDLSKKLDSIQYKDNGDGTYHVTAKATGAGIALDDNLNASQIEDTVGKDIAKKIIDGDGKEFPQGSVQSGYKNLTGLDLKVGGGWTAQMYGDSRGLDSKGKPSMIAAAARKLWAEVGEVSVVTKDTDVVYEYEDGIWATREGDVLYRSKKEAEAAANQHTPQPGFTITPAMREQVQSKGMPLFTTQRNSLGSLTADQEKALRNVGGITDPKPLWDRIKESMHINLRQKLVDQFDAIKHLPDYIDTSKMSKAEVDKVLKDSNRAYMVARLSKGGDGALESTMLYGTQYLDGDAYNVKIDESGGFARVLAALNGEHDRFLWWIAAQRAESIKKRAREAEAKYQQALVEIDKFKDAKSEAIKNEDMEGYRKAQAILNQLREARDQLKAQAEVDERLFGDQDISSLKGLNKGKFADGSSREAAFVKALGELNRYNNSVLEIAKESGLIDQAAVDIFKDQPYVPFYRVMEDGDMPAGRMSGSMLNQRAWKKMKGGTQKLNEDLLANMLMNWSHIYTASARNRAAVATLATAKQVGAAHSVPAGTKGSVKAMVQGKATHWVIDEPEIAEALMALEWAMPGWQRPLAEFKRIFTFGVTVSPFFKVKNLIRDSISAIGQSELDPNILNNWKNGWAGTDKKSQVYASMLSSGGVIRFGTSVEDNRAAYARRTIEKIEDHILDKSGWLKLAHKARDVFDWYQDQGDRSENINRAALYQEMRKKGYSHAEASFMARDLLDFSMSGSWEVVRFFAQTVPFLNARLQGLYKLGRAGKEDPKRLGAVLGAVIIASLAFMALADFGDDDDWKNREDWDRDTYWWFKIGNTAFRIPKPFEIGTIGTMAERTAELFFSNEGDKWKRYRESIKRAISSTFSLDPTPVLFKPLIEIDSNKDTFTQRPIENMSMQRMLPADRATDNTSQTAKLLGKIGMPNPLSLLKGDFKEMSPVQIDHLIRGYFGWAGGLAVGMADIVLRPAMGEGSKPDRDWASWATGQMVDQIGKADSSRYVSAYYEAMRQASEAKASYDAARKGGDTARAAEIKEDNADDLRRYERMHATQNRIGYLTRQSKKLASDKEMDAEEKRDRLDRINAEKAKLARMALVRGG